MISVGVDVSKGKSTVCILKPYGEILMAPKDYAHTQSDMSNLVTKLKTYLKLLVNKALFKVRELLGLFCRGKMEQME